MKKLFTILTIGMIFASCGKVESPEEFLNIHGDKGEPGESYNKAEIDSLYAQLDALIKEVERLRMEIADSEQGYNELLETIERYEKIIELLEKRIKKAKK